MADWLDRKDLSFNILTVACQTSSRGGSTGGNVERETGRPRRWRFTLFLHQMLCFCICWICQVLTCSQRKPEKKWSHCCQWACARACRLVNGRKDLFVRMHVQSGLIFLFLPVSLFFSTRLSTSQYVDMLVGADFYLSMCVSVHQSEWVQWGWQHAPQVWRLNWTFSPPHWKTIDFIHLCTPGLLEHSINSVTDHLI